MDHHGTHDNQRRRADDILRLLPRNRNSVLDVGARDDRFSKVFTGFFQEVTALDLTEPSFKYPGVATVAGDVTDLKFPDNSFDCVFCAEVLEHVWNVDKACRELVRVARHEIVIGVPFRQDIRIGRTTCRSCGKINPPWGHVHSFNERTLGRLFPGIKIAAKSYVGSNRQVTNPLSVFLMDRAGNPWGNYSQREPCIYCGVELEPPQKTTLPGKLCSGIASRLTKMQTKFASPHPVWIHMLLSKDGSEDAQSAIPNFH
jgi:SAM-dependent methyltransferase